MIVKNKKYMFIALSAGALIMMFVCGMLVQKYNVLAKLSNALSGSALDYAKDVDQELIDAFGIPAQIYEEKSHYIYSTQPERSQLAGSKFKDYRYYWHYKEVADYLTSDDVKQKSKRIHDDFWLTQADTLTEYVEAMEEKKQFLKETIGIKDLPENGKVLSDVNIYKDGVCTVNEVRMQSRIKSISVPLYIAKPIDPNVKGVVIALHGFSGSPEKVLGLEARDYTRQFGKELVKNGYVVFAPYVLNSGDKNTNISCLGMLYSQHTFYSIDLQKLLSVVDYIKADAELKKLPLTVYGISYGGMLSVLFGSIDNRIDIVISSGALQSAHAFLEQYYRLEKNITRPFHVIFNNAYQIYFNYSDFARLIYPRPLIIEYGAFDENPGSAAEWKNMENIYKQFDMIDKLKLVWFKGYHETAPVITIPVLNDLVNNLSRKY
ncbi:MAG: hypothetical protein JW822_01400 [Spirochaetales bacterium]|nr:hypothetical protein [Spirochaetales bacterium]